MVGYRTTARTPHGYWAVLGCEVRVTVRSAPQLPLVVRQAVPQRHAAMVRPRTRRATDSHRSSRSRQGGTLEASPGCDRPCIGRLRCPAPGFRLRSPHARDPIMSFAPQAVPLLLSPSFPILPSGYQLHWHGVGASWPSRRRLYRLVSAQVAPLVAPHIPRCEAILELALPNLVRQGLRRPLPMLTISSSTDFAEIISEFCH